VLLVALALALACAAPSAAPARQPAPAAPPTAAEPTSGTSAAPARAVGEPVPAVPDKIRILSSETSVNHSVFYFAPEKGLYERYGLEADLRNLPPDAPTILASGHAEFMTTGTGTESAAAKGVPVKMVLVTVGRPNFGVYARPDVTRPEHLRGQSIWGDNDLLRAILLKHGLEPDRDVSIVNTRTNDPRAALLAVEQGSVAAAFGWPPLGALARQQGLHELFFAANEIPEVPVSGIGTSDKLIAERSDLVKRMIAATLDTMRYMRDPANRDEVVAHYMKRWGFDRDLAEESYRMLELSLTPDGKVSAQAQRDEIELV
jgi:ABC-type nitrate/sulfonate/bicarbonate transport system substrate-binding protein